MANDTFDIRLLNLRLRWVVSTKTPMIRTATLLTATFGLITSARAAQAVDANIQIAALSQRSLPTYSLTDTGSFEPSYGNRSASDINFLGHVVGLLRALTTPLTESP